MYGQEGNLKMTYTDVSDVNITGLDSILVYVANEVPIFVPAFLLFTWLMISILIYFGTRKFAGQGDFFAGASASGFLVAVLGTVMTLTFGIINLWTLGTCFGIAIFSLIMLQIRRNRD